MERALKNSHYLFLVVLLMVFVGFYRTYFGLFPGFVGLTTLLHIHALSVLLWFACLIMQPVLIRQGKLALHRQVGWASYGIVALMIGTIVIMEYRAFQTPVVALPGGIDTNMIGLADLTFFGLCYGLALYHRRTVKYHARWMVLTVLPFINPALGRLGLPGPVLAIAIMLGLLLYERFNNRVYRPWAIALPAYLAIYIFFLFVIDRADWLGFWAIIF